MQEKNQTTDIQIWQQVATTVSTWEATQLKQAEEFKPDLTIVPVLKPDATREEKLVAVLEIPRIEKYIKEYKSLAKKTADERKGKITGQLTEITKRLMIPEKIYEEYAAEFEKKLLPLKVVENDIRKRHEHLVTYKITTQNKYNEYCERVKNYVQKKVSDVYKDCLELGEDAHENVDITEATFVIKPPMSEDIEEQEIITPIFSLWSPKYWNDLFWKELNAAFDGFDDALKDKEKAISDREEDAKVAALEAKVETRIASANIETAPTVSFATTKKLKTVSELDMPRDTKTMAEVIFHFNNNIIAAQRFYKGKDYFDVIEKIVNLLEDMNTEGHTFEGLKFTKKNVL